MFNTVDIKDVHMLMDYKIIMEMLMPINMTISISMVRNVVMIMVMKKKQLNKNIMMIKNAATDMDMGMPIIIINVLNLLK